MVKNFFRKLLKVLFITIVALIMLLSIFLVVFFFNYNFFANKFLKRDIKIGKIHFFKDKYFLEFENIEYKKLNGELLLKAKSVKINFDIPDIIQLFKLKLIIQSLEIENFWTYISYNQNKFEIPEYFDSSKKSKDQKDGIKFSFSINSLRVINGEVSLRVNGKDEELLSNLKIVIPNINDNLNEVKPEISGKLKKRDFIFTGKTTQEKDFISNDFKIKIDGIDIAKDRIPLPISLDYIIDKGKIDLDINLKINKYKKNTLFFLSGKINGYYISIYDRKNKARIVSGVNAFLSIDNISNSNNSLKFKEININSGEIKLKNLINTQNNSGNQKNSNKNVSNQKIDNKNIGNQKNKNIGNQENNRNNLEIESLNVSSVNLYIDEINLIINKFNMSNFGKKNSNFYSNFNIGGGNISAKGNINNNEEINITDVTAKNVDILYFDNFLKLKEKGLENCILSISNGEVVIKNREIDFEGLISYSDLNYKQKNFDFQSENGEFLIKYANDKEIEINKLKVKNSIFVDSNNFKIDKINFESPGKILIPVDLKSEKKIEIPIEKIYFEIDKDLQFSVNLDKIILNLLIKPEKRSGFEKVSENDANKNLTNEKINISGNLDCKSLIISSDKLAFKVADLNTILDFFILPDLKINISKINIGYVYSNLVINNNFDIIFGGFIKLNSNNKSENKKDYIHISKININDGDLQIIDNHLKQQNLFNISGISINVNNIPSYIYPSGNITFAGYMDKINPISLEATISPLETKGVFKCENINLYKFSPYTERYLNNKLTDGKIDIGCNYSIGKKNSKLDFKIVLKKIQAKKIGGLLDLDSVVKSMENNNKEVELNFNVTLTDSGKTINYFDIFFEIFKANLKSGITKILNPIPKTIKYDQSYLIINFSGGSSLIKSDIELDRNLVEKTIKEKNRVLVIRGYVDRENDMEYIKRKIIEEEAKKFNQIEDKKQIYIQILKNNYNLTYDESYRENELLNILLSKIVVTDEDFKALAYSRANSIMDYLIEKYGIPFEKIYIDEGNIYENEFVTGISNNIGIIRSGRY